LGVGEFNKLQHIAPLEIALIACCILKALQHAANVDRLQAGELVRVGCVGLWIIADSRAQLLRKRRHRLTMLFSLRSPCFQERNDL